MAGRMQNLRNQLVEAGCSHIKITMPAGYNELRVAYRGLLPDREEAMAYYTDDDEDAIGTARTMQRDWDLCVFNADKTVATLRAEAVLKGRK